MPADPKLTPPLPSAIAAAGEPSAAMLTATAINLDLMLTSFSCLNGCARHRLRWPAASELGGEVSSSPAARAASPSVPTATRRAPMTGALAAAPVMGTPRRIGEERLRLLHRDRPPQWPRLWRRDQPARRTAWQRPSRRG